MKGSLLSAIVALASIATISMAQAPHTPAASAKQAVSSKPGAPLKQMAPTAPISPEAAAWVQKNLVGWPKVALATASDLITKYGLPKESTDRALIWYDNGPWKRTVLHREEVQHNFPLPHQDALEQTVYYRVPVEKIADLIKYNGSIVVNHTSGELTAHCNNEQANMLTLNIANDIVKGDRNVEQALAYHAQVVRGVQIGEPETYPDKLRFKAPQSASDAADPAEEAQLLKHLNE